MDKNLFCWKQILSCIWQPQLMGCTGSLACLIGSKSDLLLKNNISGEPQDQGKTGFCLIEVAFETILTVCGKLYCSSDNINI